MYPWLKTPSLRGRKVKSEMSGRNYLKQGCSSKTKNKNKKTHILRDKVYTFINKQSVDSTYLHKNAYIDSMHIRHTYV